MLMVRGVRGATTVEENTEEAIIAATKELLEAVIKYNGIEEDYVASVFFSTTPDLTTAYPAKAARMLGWNDTALIGMQEADIANGLKMCIRVLIHWNTDKAIDKLVHVYMNGAEKLRPDFFYPKNKVVLNKESVEK